MSDQQAALLVAITFALICVSGMVYIEWEHIKKKLNPNLWKMWVGKALARFYRRLRARRQAVKRQKEIDIYLSDVITTAIEDAVYQGRMSRAEANKEYRRLAFNCELSDLLPRPRELKRKDIRALKTELRKLRKEPKTEGGYKKFDDNVVPIKKARVVRAINIA